MIPTQSIMHGKYLNNLRPINAYIIKCGLSGDNQGFCPTSALGVLLDRKATRNPQLLICVKRCCLIVLSSIFSAISFDSGLIIN